MLLTVGGGPQDLPERDDVMHTGQMGDCVTVVVLFNLKGGKYHNVRGWHGLGGAHTINMKRMMRGVPNASDSQIIAIPGRLQQSDFAVQGTRRHVRKVLKHGYDQVSIRLVENIFCAAIDRTGAVTRSDVLH